MELANITLLKISLIMVVLIAYIIDYILADPSWLYHPVVLIGKFIKFQEIGFIKLACINKNVRKRERLLKKYGAILVFTTIVTTMLVCCLILYLSYAISIKIFSNTVLLIIVSGLICWTCFSNKTLAKEAWSIEQALGKKDLQLARIRLQRIVGRDTSKLKEDEIIRATVESISENLIDGFVSPLVWASSSIVLVYIYLLVFAKDTILSKNIATIIIALAPILAMTYKAINTMDSMIGYKNEKYKDLGMVAAKIDDLANLIGARLGSINIIIAASIYKLLGKNIDLSIAGGIKTLIRDRYKHASPNCAFPEAAFSGLLGIGLGGSHIYFGQEVYKPHIGEDKKIVNQRIIRRAINLMHFSAFISLLFVVILIAII